MKTTQEIQDMKKDCAKAIGEVTDGSEDVYKGWVEALNWVEQPEPVLATRHNDNEVIDVTLTEDIAFEEGFEQGKLAQKKGDEESYVEDPADRDDKHYHEEQDHIAMEKAKENK